MELDEYLAEVERPVIGYSDGLHFDQEIDSSVSYFQYGDEYLKASTRRLTSYLKGLKEFQDYLSEQDPERDFVNAFQWDARYGLPEEFGRMFCEHILMT